jgi:glycosyltransferase involved in cell wall biosynthesis
LKNADFHYVESRIKVKKQRQFNKMGVMEHSLFASALKSFLKKINNSFIIPDYSIFSVFNVFKKAKEIIFLSEIDTVIISAPPNGLSLVVPLLKRNYKKLNVILEYRDSWNTQPIFAKNNRISNYISIKLEKFILRRIDHFVYVSPIVPRLLLDVLGVDVEHKSTLIMNGFVEPQDLDYKNAFLKKTDISLAYFGVLNDFEDSFRSIKKLKELLLRSPEIVSLDLYGHVEFQDFDLESESNISYKGSVDHSAVFGISQNYDFLVMLHTDEASAIEPIPGKFFDYLLSRKPILCVMSKRSFIAQFIEHNRLGLVVDPSDIAEINLGNALEAFKYNNGFDISPYSRSSQFAKYIPLLS